MKCLVMVTMDGTDDAAKVDALLESAAAVCAGAKADVEAIGTFARQGRKSEETVRTAVVELGAVDGAAKRLESVLRAMLVASGLGGCEARAWDGENEVPAKQA